MTNDEVRRRLGFVIRTSSLIRHSGFVIRYCRGVSALALKHHSSSSGQIAYYQRGMGDPLVLVHGVYPGASHHEFRRNIDSLSRQFTVYALDLLGFGESDMPRLTYTAQIYQLLLREFVVEVIGKRTHVVGSGVSCGAVVSLAVYDDLLVDRIVLIDPLVDPTQTDTPPSLANKLQQFLLGTLSMGVGLYETVSSEFEIKRFLLTRFADPKHVKPELVRDLHERAIAPSALHPVISHMTGHLAIDAARWLRYVRNPVLVIWGEKSGPPPTEQLLRPATWSKGKQIEVIPKAAHWPHDEQSAKVNQIMLHFLNA
jgi:pimeloyl-ACP methyl ester carboxylesterase